MAFKTVLYDLDDFTNTVARDRTIYYDLNVRSRSHPLPAASIMFSLFGLSRAGDVLEYRDKFTVDLMRLDPGDSFDAAVNRVLEQYKTVARSDFNARPGRFEITGLSSSDSGVVPAASIDNILSRMDQIEADLSDLSRRLSRMAMGGGYDD